MSKKVLNKAGLGDTPMLVMVQMYSLCIVNARKRLKGYGLRTTDLHTVMVVATAKDGATVAHMLNCGHTNRIHAWRVLGSATGHGLVTCNTGRRKGAKANKYYLSPKGQTVYDVMREEFGELWDLAANMLVDEVRRRVAKG